MPKQGSIPEMFLTTFKYGNAPFLMGRRCDIGVSLTRNLICGNNLLSGRGGGGLSAKIIQIIGFSKKMCISRESSYDFSGRVNAK